jgi:hypothetical protein
MRSAQKLVSEIASLIERTARWVARETFELLPVWFPEHSRRSLIYKANWSEPQLNKTHKTGVSVHKLEGNIYANQAITMALGSTKAKRPNWSCCHIWGGDDLTYQKSNDVVSDPRFYSCVGNMVLLPTPLKVFTDSMAEIKAMLRICARNLYGWQCDHESMSAVNVSLDKCIDWSAYPKSWPRKHGEQRPLGIVDLTPTIEKSAARRLATMRNDLQCAGKFYPKDAVRTALAYWGIKQNTVT